MIVKYYCQRCKRPVDEREAVECDMPDCTMYEKYQTVDQPRATWSLDYTRADRRGDQGHMSDSIINTEYRY